MTEVVVWSGWIGGIGIGLYGLAQLWLSGQPLGVSTGFGNVCALASRRSFFRTGPYADPFNWRLWFLLGIPLGGLLAALSSPGPLVASFSLGRLYDQVLPSAVWAKGAVLFAGGALMGLGARMADGCTSGHAIAGVSLLNPPSLLAAAGFFVGGTAAVQALFRLTGHGG
ncbi:MAG: YeeE/YedE family protein [Deltaproteobacteria bacterium]|nr:YeeE/YedE family protein [Deltaproteobacteria bacterium]